MKAFFDARREIDEALGDRKGQIECELRIFAIWDKDQAETPICRLNRTTERMEYDTITADNLGLD